MLHVASKVRAQLMEAKATAARVPYVKRVSESMNMWQVGAPGRFFTVKLDEDFDTRCCHRARRDRIVCPHIYAASEATGQDPARYGKYQDLALYGCC